MLIQEHVVLLYHKTKLSNSWTFCIFNCCTRSIILVFWLF